MAEHSRQHELFEVIERLLADHDDSKLYTQLDQTAGRITLPCTHTYMPAITYGNVKLHRALSVQQHFY